jgi:uracil-DNA glycosylase family 4
MNALFPDPITSGSSKKMALPVHVLHQMGCKVCPLAKLDNKNPDMPASGSDTPIIYVLGEAPGGDEDLEGIQFVGKSGKFLHKYLPPKWQDKVRYNNVVRTRPYKNETPSTIAIECCRPSVVRDIERTKPKVIFGFGNIPLQWVCGQTGILGWRGRKLPVKIGSHTCWYFPMLHPAYILRGAEQGGRMDGEKVGAEEMERTFKFDMQRALAEIKHLPPAVVHTPAEVFANIHSISTDMEAVRDAFEWAMDQEAVGFDYETHRLRPYEEDATILTFSFATNKVGYSIAYEHPEATWTDEELDEIDELLKRFFSSKVRKYVHHLAFELEWTGVKFGRKYVRTPGWHDTANQAAIIDERRGTQKPGFFSLDVLVLQYFGFNLKKLSSVDRKKLRETPLPTVLLYNGGDARYHFCLGEVQRRIIASYAMTSTYDLAVRRVPTLVLAQIKGVPVDQKENRRLRKKYKQRIKDAEERLFGLKVVNRFEQIKKREFNPGSGPDVLYVVKDLLNARECRVLVDKRKEIYKWKADEKVLTQIKHPFGKALIDYRKPTKRFSTYLIPYSDDLPGSAVFPDGLLHPTFNSYFAATGRLSCDDPNLQNVPKRDEEAKEVRRQIAALFNRWIVAADYGQIEARLIAVASEDKVFTKSLWEKYDVHFEWAERIAHAYPSRIGGRKFLKDKAALGKLRSDVKNQWTFPLFFGATIGKASNSLGIPEDVLKPLYNEFWRIFTGVKDWQEEQVKFYNTNGYVETFEGRRRRAPLSYNQVINHPIQGTAAEIVMDAMSRLSELNDWMLQPEINIHDDLTFLSIPDECFQRCMTKIIDAMLDVPFKWARKVPWSIEVSYGRDWLNLEKAGDFFSHEWVFERELRRAA